MILRLLMSEDSLRGRDVREGALMVMLQTLLDLSALVAQGGAHEEIAVLR